MSWYVLQVKAGSERSTAARLGQTGYYYYLPKLPLNKMKGEKIEEAAFPGYLFIQLVKDKDDFHPVKYTPGVLRIISFSRDKNGNLEPTAIPDEKIESIMACENSGFGLQSEYAKGDKVRIKSGPFADYEAEIDKIMQKSGEERAVLLIRHLEKAIQVEAKTKDFRPVD